MKNTMNIKSTMRLVILCLCAASFAHYANAQIASGGNYTLTQTVIASGGASGAGASTNGNYSLEGTIGQAAAGMKQQNAAYKFEPGFWTAQAIFTPTAADVTVSGRIVTRDDGRGIRNVLVTMTAASGATRTVISGAFGNFRFADVPAGETYIFSVRAKRYSFNQPAQVRSIDEDTGDIIFTASFEKRVLPPQSSDIRP